MVKGTKTPADKQPVTAKKRSKAAKAGLTFPVARIARRTKQLGGVPRIRGTTATFIAAACEYIMAEVLELAGNKTRMRTKSSETQRSRITQRDVMLAIAEDEQLSMLFMNAEIGHSGVVPRIEKNLLRPAARGSKGATSNGSI